MEFLVQASSRSWAGDIEHCVKMLDGKPAIYWTIKRIYDNFPKAKITIIAPEFDAGGLLEDLKRSFTNLKTLYCFDDSPLLRMIEATKCLHEDTPVVRLNALVFQFDVALVEKMYSQAIDGGYDCIKTPDDYPVHFTGEVYRAGALTRIYNILKNGSVQQPEIHAVHPKFMIMRRPEFKTKYLKTDKEQEPRIVAEYIEKMRQVMDSERQNVSGQNQIAVGDQLSYHYELAGEFLKEKSLSSGYLLDIACGTGFGARMFSGKGFQIVAADYDEDLIATNKKKWANYQDISFQKEDIMNTYFQDSYFDAVFSMETFEHIDPEKGMAELRRVLKNGGLMVLSTPQNSTTGKCVNPQHVYEYSLEETRAIISKYFTIDKIIGLKAGKIYFPDDPVGANTVVFAHVVK